MASKKYQKIKQAAPAQAVDVQAAAAFIKKHARQSFDETIELHIRLNINPQKSELAVRGSVVLPAGAISIQRIVVITDEISLQEAATAAGAARTGGEDIIAEIIESGTLDADSVIATPAMMPRLTKAARILGPKGLMPNPKTGTVTDDPGQAVAELMDGKISFKMDQLGNIHLAIAKTSWAAEKIVANAEAALAAVRQAKPAAAKGEYIRSITLSSTMGPGIRVAA
ncbi:MAG: 50S ribosomal protein L1 [Candidatus Andersenbacteria bacterium CG10_big_fil_rev_8_21_14_0_10_54_11]|uniref:Large ribosomal subunit protein uL1 n=1 Tax=Candidatus Andersenbacteria bacterium CG10_big_fil_rev_8_21_14_0_10_54_11 TaxID=1974485 RepID=A0A2M6WYW2_9BACT|nr:MAG: 50S ribosomal protein L1 [Candidatus Andersenbacteria bacterium CG10_big_fil_rev_8_21_14_0_10_54_11]